MLVIWAVVLLLEKKRIGAWRKLQRRYDWNAMNRKHLPAMVSDWRISKDWNVYCKVRFLDKSINSQLSQIVNKAFLNIRIQDVDRGNSRY